MRIAVDTGGTFTDCVFVRNGRLEILKLPSTPRNPADALARALQEIFQAGARGDSSGLDLACGTTVGTNALLERRGGRIALVTTAGFEDVLEIGRQARPQLYNLFPEKAEPLVPARLRFGVRERLDFRGRVLVAPSSAEIARVARQVARSGANAVAICLLFSFVNPKHERTLAGALSRAGMLVSVSHEILPEFREFERTATTVVNAYLMPVMSRYLGEIERHASSSRRKGQLRGRLGAREGLRRGRATVRIMQSGGGILSARAAAREPVGTILSGPAGGVMGAQYVASLAGFERIITFDMGGTSTDVALLQGETESALATTSETIVSGLPVAVPMLDIHTVGAGGGSLARFDRAGALRVGPESAGADPGPICYGRGETPTVTDANLSLGRIPETGLVGGTFKLDAQRTRRFMVKQRGPIGSVERFAQGILDVANTVIEKAIRVISVERGHDPRDYTLVAFGGAGPLHACELAAALGIRRVLVPCLPGGLSAFGILRADVTKDLSRTIRLEVRIASEARQKLRREFARLEREGKRQMQAEGYAAGLVRVERALDVRYFGQSYELRVPFAGDYVATFHRAHEQRYGYSESARTCEVVNVRARFSGRTPKPGLPRARRSGASSASAIASKNVAYFDGKRLPVLVYERAKLSAGNKIAGPAIIAEYSATTLIPPLWRCHVDPYQNLILEPRR
jgi:N-methylhydantoinase A